MRTNQDCGKTPAELGYRMPAEWEKHEATWLGWPHNPEDWPDKLDTIRWVYGEMVRRIGAGEKVRLLVRNRPEEALARNDAWTFFSRLPPGEGSGGHLITGPTQTNVMDVHIGLIGG
mgnify:CR=1 FL=1